MAVITSRTQWTETETETESESEFESEVRSNNGRWRINEITGCKGLGFCHRTVIGNNYPIQREY